MTSVPAGRGADGQILSLPPEQLALYSLWTVYFCDFPLNIFRLRLTTVTATTDSENADKRAGYRIQHGCSRPGAAPRNVQAVLRKPVSPLLPPPSLLPPFPPSLLLLEGQSLPGVLHTWETPFGTCSH